jgi:hypothetical protein
LLSKYMLNSNSQVSIEKIILKSICFILKIYLYNTY